MSIPTLGRSEQPNPMLVLANSQLNLAEATEKLAGEVRRLTSPKHEYVIVPTDENDPSCSQWMVYCRICSAEIERFVWPCPKLAVAGYPVPPAGFTAAPAPDSAGG